MNDILLSYSTTCGATEQELMQFGRTLLPEIKRVQDALVVGYQTAYASINLPKDTQVHHHVKDLVSQKKQCNPTMLIVVGIGGSNLGTIAVQQALYGRHYNDLDPAIKIYYVDSLEADYIHDMLLIAQRHLESGQEVLVNIISKSGTTTETIANAHFFINLLKKYRHDTWQKFLVITTDEGSELYKIAVAQQWSILTIPDKVGGRFSVFSAVGLFPLAFIGVDIERLTEGAQRMVDRSTTQDVFENPAALSALILYAAHTRGISIADFFLFSVDLEGCGKWYRQLMAESIGKDKTIHGAAAEVGMTPTVSVGTNDLHSVLQLYLAGPRDKITTFVQIANQKNDLKIPEMDEIVDLVAHVSGRSVSSVSSAILHGVLGAYTDSRRPYLINTLPDKSAYALGQFLQMKMIEIMYLGFLFEVNPFDQPNVEHYKSRTRKILADE